MCGGFGMSAVVTVSYVVLYVFSYFWSEENSGDQFEGFFMA